MKILIIVTSISRYESGLETGLWLSELTHIYDKTNEQGYEVTIASPKGGNVPVDPESLKPLVLDRVSKHYWEDSTFRKELENSKTLEQVAGQEFDLVYLAGGHGTMYDFPSDTPCSRSSKKCMKTEKKSPPSATASVDY